MQQITFIRQTTNGTTRQATKGPGIHALWRHLLLHGLSQSAPCEPFKASPGSNRWRHLACIPGPSEIYHEGSCGSLWCHQAHMVGHMGPWWNRSLINDLGMQNFILPMECSFSGLQEPMGLRNGQKPLLGWKRLFHTLFLTNNFTIRLQPMQNFIIPMECSFSGLEELMGLRNGPKPLLGWKQLFHTLFLTNNFSKRQILNQFLINFRYDATCYCKPFLSELAIII